MSSETMLWLSNNYIAGTVVLAAVLILVYVAVSLFIIHKARRRGDDLCVAGMIPVWRFIYPIKYVVYDFAERRLAARKAKEEKEASEE